MTKQKKVFHFGLRSSEICLEYLTVRLTEHERREIGLILQIDISINDGIFDQGIEHLQALTQIIAIFTGLF